jgi:hypothetical protein
MVFLNVCQYKIKKNVKRTSGDEEGRKEKLLKKSRKQQKTFFAACTVLLTCYIVNMILDMKPTFFSFGSFSVIIKVSRSFFN